MSSGSPAKSAQPKSAQPPDQVASGDGRYVVVARRYRPGTFDDLVGQGQVSQALRNAITMNRVGHAYLFTGARGVGKTSTARIMAKALNCVSGPTTSPCNQCDICHSIAVGEDMDVVEIDGASNRGIDEIRQLRSNVNIRPSRARFKVYIIDEVHMLTTAAFNALLKTLEEPPEHVKFIFCTTDPEKIPITVLSRCQRFDFPPVETASIAERLKFIVENEGVEADDEALFLLARRAGGSLRDSQSLLEQLLSFCSERITVDEVHRLLGTAKGGRLISLCEYVQTRNAAGALAELDAAISEGVDVGQFAEQLLGHLRDLMATAVGCGPEFLLHNPPAEHPQLQQAARDIGLHSLLSMVQILDQTLTKLRQSTQVRALVEVALVRICCLADLDDLPELIARLSSGSGVPPAAGAGVPAAGAGPGPQKKKPLIQLAASGEVSEFDGPMATPNPGPAQSIGLDPPRPAAGHTLVEVSDPAAVTPDLGVAIGIESRDCVDGPSAEPGPASLEIRSAIGPELANPPVEAGSIAAALDSAPDLSPDTDAMAIWSRTLASLEDITADFARSCVSVAISAPNRLVVGFTSGYSFKREYCERPDRKAKIEEALTRVAGRAMRLDLVEVADSAKPAARGPQKSRVQRIRETEKHPLVRRAIELFDAEVVRINDPRQELAGSLPEAGT